MKPFLILTLAALLSACDDPPPPVAKGPRYDHAFVEERKLELARLQGKMSALESVQQIEGRAGQTAEMEALEGRIEAAKRRIKHALDHLGEPYVHVEEP